MEKKTCRVAVIQLWGQQEGKDKEMASREITMTGRRFKLNTVIQPTIQIEHVEAASFICHRGWSNNHFDTVSAAGSNINA